MDHVLSVTPVHWDDLRGRSLLVTGGTGFVGTWLLATFAWINRALGLDATLTAVSRRPAVFAARAPGVASDPALTLIQGDVRCVELPGPFDFVVHAASQEPERQSDAALLAKAEADVAGTRHILELARRARAERVLFTSSGAVYGIQPPELALIEEDYDGVPDPREARAAYGRAKRDSEELCLEFDAGSGAACTIARLFAFVGPLLPLRAGYAAGDFLADALHGGPVRVAGDGTPYRSYLYAADLAAWLWTILLRGESCRAYNVGSDRALTVAELAGRVARLATPPMTVTVGDQAATSPPSRYVPSIDRARSELGLDVLTDLDAALERTWAWLHLEGRHMWER